MAITTELLIPRTWVPSSTLTLQAPFVELEQKGALFAFFFNYKIRLLLTWSCVHKI